MSKPIVIRVTQDTGAHLKGAEFGFASERDAEKIVGAGNFIVVGAQGGARVEDAPKPPSLSAMTRAELDAHATSLGVEDAAGLPNIAAVIAAIEAASSTQDAD